MSEIKPVAYFRATKKRGIIWSEDCCCVDPVFDDDYDNGYDGEDDETFSLPVYSAAAYEALQKENVELKELLGKSLESLKNDCKTFADCRPRPYSMSQAEQEAWFSCWNSIYDDINNLDLSKYAETKKAVL